jgi:hypothetical protein
MIPRRQAGGNDGDNRNMKLAHYLRASIFTHLLALEAVANLAHPVALDMCHNLVTGNLFWLLPGLGLFIFSVVAEDDSVKQEPGLSNP